MDFWRQAYDRKKMAAQQAIQMIRPGARIFLGTGCGQPLTLLEEMIRSENQIVDAEIYQFMTVGPAPYIDEEHSRVFRTFSFYPGSNLWQGLAAGRGDYVPVSLFEIPTLFRTGRIPLDVVFIQTSPPDKNGALSLGISVDIVKAAVENGLMVIAEVNEKMPRTFGDSSIPIDVVDAIVESNRDLVEYALPASDPVSEAICRNVAALIEDGSTLEIGLGDLPQKVLRCLGEKNDLGIHTEMFTDEIVPIVEKGIINGSRKTLNRGRNVASFCCGTRRLYDLVRENPMFEFRPAEYVCDPYIIGQHNRMVSINTAMEIDMTGQACTDSQGYAFTSGVGGHHNFTRGAVRAREGKPILALPSTRDGGKVSNIVPRLTEGASVTVVRSDVHYVVTEFGAAYLFGKSIRERVLALASIAHADFRNEILVQAKNRKYIYSDQKELPTNELQYPREFETEKPLSDGTVLFFRPMRPTDDKLIRDLLYSCSEQSIAFRFIRKIQAFPHKFIQELTNVDFSKDMAITAVVQGMGGEQIVAVGRYYLDTATNRAEVSFLVRDDWQTKGLGTDLFRMLIEIAKKRGVAGFKANVLADNDSMMNLFYNSGCKITAKRENDLFHVSFDFGTCAS